MQHALVEHRSRPAVIVDIPVQYFQSVIAIEVGVAGVLLFQIRFFDTRTACGMNRVLIRGCGC